MLGFWRQRTGYYDEIAGREKLGKGFGTPKDAYSFALARTRSGAAPNCLRWESEGGGAAGNLTSNMTETDESQLPTE